MSPDANTCQECWTLPGKAYIEAKMKHPDGTIAPYRRFVCDNCHKKCTALIQQGKMPFKSMPFNVTLAPPA